MLFARFINPKPLLPRSFRRSLLFTSPTKLALQLLLLHSTAFANQSAHPPHITSIQTKMAASMARGLNGRIEEAFASAKERGEAAFVTFVTAGFPSKDGELMLIGIV
jgi:hypothetical protein